MTDIAVVDSGLGGLAAVHDVMLSFPRADLAYVVDPGVLPLASAADVRLAATRIESVVGELAASVVIVVCDALISAGLGEALNRRLSAEIVELPYRRLAEAAERYRSVGVVASAFARDAGTFEACAGAMSNPPQLIVRGSAGLDRLLLERPVWDQQLDTAVKTVVTELLEAGAQLIILGASHAWLARTSFRRYAGPNTIQAEIASTSVRTITRPARIHPRLRFYVPAHAEYIRERASTILQLEIKPEQIIVTRGRGEGDDRPSLTRAEAG